MKKQKKKLKIKSKIKAMTKCPNCKGELGHFCPPSGGDPGFFICKDNSKATLRLNVVKGVLIERLNEIEDDWDNSVLRDDKLNQIMKHCVENLRACTTRIRMPRD